MRFRKYPQFILCQVLSRGVVLDSPSPNHNKVPITIGPASSRVTFSSSQIVISSRKVVSSQASRTNERRRFNSKRKNKQFYRQFESALADPHIVAELLNWPLFVSEVARRWSTKLESTQAHLRRGLAGHAQRAGYHCKSCRAFM